MDSNLKRAWLSAIGAMPLLHPVVWTIAGIAFVDGRSQLLTITAIIAGLILSYFQPFIYPGITISKRIIVPLIFFMIGGGDMLINRPTIISSNDFIEGDGLYIGIVETASENNSGQTLEVRLTGDSSHLASLKIELYLQMSIPEITPGDIISFEAELRPVKIVKDVDEEIDPGEFLLRRGISAVCFINNTDQIRIVDRTILSQITAPFVELGRKIGYVIDETPLSPFTRAILRTFLAGDRTSLSPGEVDMFSAAGVSHMLAISGAHVGIIAIFAGFILLPFSLWGFQRTASILSLLAVWVFVLISGCQPSAIRAAVMATVMMLSRMYNRQHTASNALLISAMVILLVAPEQLFNVGFQLSLGAVAGILMFADAINVIPHKSVVLRFFGDAISISLSASFVTAPIVALCFHSFPLYFLLCNIVVSILVPWIMILGAITVLLIATHLPCGLFVGLIDILTHLLEKTTEVSASLPGNTVTGIYFPSLIMVVYFVTLLLLWCGLKTHRRMRYGLLTSAFILFGSCLAITIISRPINTPEWIVRRASRYSEIIVNTGDTLKLYTSAESQPEKEMRLADISQRYKAYMAYRRLEGPFILSSDSSYRLEDICRRGLVTIGVDTIFIIDRHTLSRDMPLHSDYALLSDWAVENITKFYGGGLNCDTVICFGSPAIRFPSVNLSEVSFRRPIRDDSL